MPRLLLIAVVAVLAVFPAIADQILGPGQIDNAGKVVLPGGPTLGIWRSGKYTLTPDGVSAVGDATVPVRPEWASGLPLDLMRYNGLFQTRTKRDGDSWESAVGIEFHSSTGYNRPFVASGDVALGENLLVTTGVPEGYIYRVLKAGKLGAESPTAGPGTAPFMSGTAQLQWINLDNLAAKIAFTNTAIVDSNAGKTWLNNFNYSMRKLNNMPSFMVNTEFDFYNGSGIDCALFSGKSCGSLALFTGGPNITTAVIGLSPLASTPANGYAAEWGITMKGPNLIRDAAIDIATNGKMAFSTGRNANVFGTSTYSQTVWRDEATSPYALSLGGNYTQAAIDLQSATTPVAVAAAAGQKICFFGTNNCFVKDNSQGKLLYQVNGTTVMSIADDGTIRSKGAIIANTKP